MAALDPIAELIKLEVKFAGWARELRPKILGA